MKRLANGILLLVIMFLFVPSSFVFAKEFYEAVPFNVNVCVIRNKEESAPENMEAYLIEGLGYFRLRDLSAVMDFCINYDAKSETVSIDTRKPSDEVISKLNNVHSRALITGQKLYINGKKIESMMAYNINGQNYFPIRELCENTGFECVWDQDENKIVITMDQPEKTDSLFTTISDTIILDLKNGDCTALTEYLDQNVSEFDKETCLLESINKQSEDGDYLITYRMFKSGLKTPNELLVFVDDNGSMKYVNKLNNPMLSDIDFEFMNMDIEKAKQEAMNQYDGCVIIEQKVEERIDTN